MTTNDWVPSTEALQRLKDGNVRFTQNKKRSLDLLSQVKSTKDGQKPYAVIISCMDSRTPPEHIFDLGIGECFTIRIAGNVITPEIVGSTEYGCKVVGASLIFVLGHKGCGAIKGALGAVELGSLGTVTSRIVDSFQGSTNADEVAVNHVRMGMKSILEESEILRGMASEGKLTVKGGVYDIATGEVNYV